MRRLALTRLSPTRLVLAVVLAPLALGLAACSKKDEATAPVSAGPIAKIAPPAGKSWQETIAKTPEGGYLMGNPQAPIKLVEYGSLSCPHCAKFAQDGFQKLANDYVGSGRVSFEFRSFVIHPQDVPLTVLAGCGSTEAFIPLVEQVYTNFDTLTAATERGAKQAEAAMQLPENQRFVALADVLSLTPFFAARGISTDQAKACLADFSKATAVANHAEEYGKQGVDSTPTLMINGSKLPGNTWAETEAALQQAGAR